jgi:hypothetical protein
VEFVEKPDSEAMRSLLSRLIQVPKAEVDRLEAERPKKRKRKKPAA